MIILLFKGVKGHGDALTKLEMDRKTKELWVTSPKTFYQRTKAKWKMLFDAGKEEEQERFSDQLDDTRFIGWIVGGMKQVGYKLVKYEELENGNRP